MFKNLIKNSTYLIKYFYFNEIIITTQIRGFHIIDHAFLHIINYRLKSCPTCFAHRFVHSGFQTHQPRNRKVPTKNFIICIDSSNENE